VIDEATPPRRRVSPLPPEDRRAAIVAATLPLVEEHGPNISTRQIAEAAGVAEGTLFRVFPDKLSLIHATILAAVEPSGTIVALKSVADDVDVRARVGKVVDAIAERVTRHQRLFTVAREMAMTEGCNSDFSRALQENRERVMAAVVRVIASDAALLRISPENTARLLMLLIVSARGHVFAEPAMLTRDEIVEVFLDGVLKPTAENGTTKESSC
jgi:AcrR family transcriptional regulator